jgi:hypothetical protein
MGDPAPSSARVFKSAWFSKAQRKSRISDGELCRSAVQSMIGQAVNLGGGVFKKRLQKNLYRAILLVVESRFCVFEYLYAKSDRDNIEEDELANFKKLASIYAGLTVGQIVALIREGSWIEICK